MRTQPQDIIAKLEADNSRLGKEQIIEDAMNEGLDEFFEGITMTVSYTHLTLPTTPYV